MWRKRECRSGRRRMRVRRQNETRLFFSEEKKQKTFISLSRNNEKTNG
jgi:hypothetical protein